MTIIYSLLHFKPLFVYSNCKLCEIYTVRNFNGINLHPINFLSFKFETMLSSLCFFCYCCCCCYCCTEGEKHNCS